MSAGLTAVLYTAAVRQGVRFLQVASFNSGRSDNNILENLRLVCPNCHALTPTYKGKNNGNGRARRRQRYREGKSY